MSDEPIPSIDEYADTLCYGLWLVLQTANGAYAAHGPEFAHKLGLRVLSTPKPDEPAERCQFEMMRLIARMLALKEQPK